MRDDAILFRNFYTVNSEKEKGFMGVKIGEIRQKGWGINGRWL